MKFNNISRAFVAGTIVIALAAILAGCNGSAEVASATSQPEIALATSLKRDVMPAFKGMSSLLDGWTYSNKFGEDDWRVDTDMDAHGAKPIEGGDVPDIRLDRTGKNGQEFLQIRYRGKEILINLDDPNYQALVRRAILDISQVRLGELKDLVDKQLATK
ncbi:MAG: hypothetical protein Q7K33_01135 [Candidatus Berkelbacteria bacterium]|nr:hypothetical protein [Candidatus Berkelbacteria bacterium]